MDDYVKEFIGVIVKAILCLLVLVSIAGMYVVAYSVAWYAIFDIVMGMHVNYLLAIALGTISVSIYLYFSYKRHMRRGGNVLKVMRDTFKKRTPLSFSLQFSKGEE